MKDKDFLIWLCERLELIHKENPNVDYMLKLKSIICDYPEDKITPNTYQNPVNAVLIFDADYDKLSDDTKKIVDQQIKGLKELADDETI